MYNNSRSNYSSTHDISIRDVVYETLNQAIEKGLSMLNGFIDERQYQIWVDYSKEIIQITTRNTNLNLYANYLSIILTLYNANMSPNDKLMYCVKWLVDVMKEI
jgi:hypothetical protein